MKKSSYFTVCTKPTLGSGNFDEQTIGKVGDPLFPVFGTNLIHQTDQSPKVYM